MALKAVLLLLATIGFVHSQSHCSAFGGGTNDGQDCSCADKSFNHCPLLPADNEIHAADFENCKNQCDFFASFGACDWFKFDQTGGEDENCKLFGPDQESMAGYLMRCEVFGGPLRNEEDTCLADPGGMVCNDVFCPGGCASCAGDRCSGFAGTECSMTSPVSATQENLPNAFACQTLMTTYGISDIINYFLFDNVSQECKGYPSGRRSCNYLVAVQTMDLADIQSCQSFL